MAQDRDSFLTFLTVREAARRLRVSPGRLRAAIRKGDLPAYRPGTRWVRLWQPDLIAWLRSQRVATASVADEAHARRRVRAHRRSLGSSSSAGRSSPSGLSTPKSASLSSPALA